MPIIDLQRRLHEAGRIRIGEKVAMSGGKTRPGKLSSFRFTSSDDVAIKSIAELYGGTVEPWEDAPTGTQWQVTTETTSFDVIIPPPELAFTQWMETWSGGGCTRRCDGQTNTLTDKPCDCDPDSPACKPTTRLGVIIMALQGIGVWRLELHGWNGAQELAGTIDVMRATNPRGMVPGRLLLSERQSKSEGKTHNFVVPVLDLNVSVAALTNGASVGPQLGSGHVTPVPRLDARLTVAEQLAAVDDTSRLRSTPRANAAATLPPTGLAPRAAGAVIDVEAHEPVLVPDVQESPQADEKTSDDTPKTTQSTKTHGGASRRSLNRLFAILGGMDIKSDEARHVWASKGLGIGVESFNDLTQDQIKTLSDIAEGTAPPASTEPVYPPGQEPF